MRADESALQLAPAQQSPPFMQSEPSPRQGGIMAGPFAHRPTPSAPAVHIPEQHSDAEPQRSCSGWQPGSRWQRLGPPADASQRPEQQSLSFMQMARAGPQPGSAWQRASSPGALTQRPLQQSPLVPQVSPSTRHPSSREHVDMPDSVGSPQVRPQQSASPMQLSPAGWQPSGAGAHIPPMHAPAQQSWAIMQGPPAAAQVGGPQVPATQPSEQHVPARTQGCPSEEHPAGLAQTRAPVPAASGAHRYEQQSAPVAQELPSGRQTAGVQTPSPHEPEQQS